MKSRASGHWRSGRGSAATVVASPAAAGRGTSAAFGGVAGGQWLCADCLGLVPYSKSTETPPWVEVG